MRPRSLLRTTGFRLALLGAGLASLTAGIVFALIYSNTLGAMRAALDAEIRNEAAEIAAPGRTLSQAAVVSAIQGALAEPHGGIFYAFVDRRGRTIAGNLPVKPLSSGWHNLTAPEGTVFAPHVHVIRGLAQPAGGGILFVGENATTLNELDELMRRSFAIGFGITLLTGLGAGLLFGRRALARIEAVGATSREIMAGDLTRRLALSGSGDEFDHLAEAINAMLARIETLMENIRQAGNELAHDLRSPLSRLRETLELALREPEPSRMQGAIEEAIIQVDDSLALFAAILRLAQIESRTRRASFVEVDLSALLTSLAETYETVAEEAGQSLAAAVAPDLRLHGDAALLTQLFANLIENAVKHCAASAKITLTAAPASLAIEVTVRDDGPGIPAGQRDLVLRRFGRLEASRTSDGHGLGLPLAVAIAGLHDAELTLEEARPGLLVVIRFPKPPG
jgi:signal transduction histidine kinase